MPAGKVIELSEMPSGAALIAKAGLTSRGRPGAKAGLPDREVRAPEVKQDVARFAAYSRICGFTLRDRVPPTWLHVLTFPLQMTLLLERDFPFPIVGMVHVGNAMRQLRPVELGETLALTTHAESLRSHRRGVTVDVVGEARVGEELVWRGVSTYLARGESLGSASQTAGESDSSAGAEVASKSDGGSAAESGAAKVEASGRHPEGMRQLAVWRVPSDLGREYAAVSGDMNPIHLNSLAAKALGFPRTIAHGMWTHAKALAALEPRLPEAYEVEVAFTKPVLLPSTLGFSATGMLEGQDFAVTNRDGSKTHLTGSIRA